MGVDAAASDATAGLEAGALPVAVEPDPAGLEGLRRSAVQRLSGFPPLGDADPPLRPRGSNGPPDDGEEPDWAGAGPDWAGAVPGGGGGGHPPPPAANAAAGAAESAAAMALTRRTRRRTDGTGLPFGSLAHGAVMAGAVTNCPN